MSRLDVYVERELSARMFELRSWTESLRYGNMARTVEVTLFRRTVTVSWGIRREV